MRIRLIIDCLIYEKSEIVKNHIPITSHHILLESKFLFCQNGLKSNNARFSALDQPH